MFAVTLNETSATALSIVHLLLYTTILLAFGSVGMLIVRLATPQFSAFEWMSGAFAAGAVSTTLMIFVPSLWGGVLPDLALLLGFVLLHKAVLALSENSPKVPRLSVLLLLLEVLAGLLISKGYGMPHLRGELLGLLIAAQAGQTASQAIQVGRRASRGPVWFLVTDLLCLASFNLAWSFLQASGQVFGGGVGDVVLSTTEELTFFVYLVTTLGFALGFFWLTTELQATKLEDMAGTDPLTRAANRRNFLQWCEQERERSLRSGATFSVLIADIDHFKRVNDTFGHAVGDTVICDVVEKMRDAIRGIDVIGRWGGEEFVILLRESSAGSALVVAERLRKGVEEMTPTATAIRYAHNQRVTVSVGIASYQDNDEIADLIARADSALYQAKAAGRNRVRTMPEDIGITLADLAEATRDAEDVAVFPS